MGLNYKLKEIIIKDRTRYYFDDIIKLKDFDHNNILIDKKSCKKILAYNISYKTLMGAKPMCIRFDKVNKFI